MEELEPVTGVDRLVLMGAATAVEVVEGAGLEGGGAEAVVDGTLVVAGAVVVVGAVVVGAVVAEVVEAGPAVLSKHLQALETLEGSSLPTQLGIVESEPARNLGQNATAWLA